jgi:hypothetical protein
MEPVNKVTMNTTIDFKNIEVMLKLVPKKYKTDNIRVARGKYKLPVTFKQLIKRIINDPS